MRRAPVDNDPTGRRSRWILELDVYDYHLVHREGRQHANADAMSRRPSPEACDKATQCGTSTVIYMDNASPTVAVMGYDANVAGSPDLGTPYPIVSTKGDEHNNLGPADICSTLTGDLDKLSKQQGEDGCLRTVIAWLMDSAQRPPIGQLKNSSPTLRKLWHEFPKLVMRQGVLCRRTKQHQHESEMFQVVLPAALIPTALEGLHGNHFSGHLSAERTLQRARRICFWPYMARDINKFCAECVACQKRGSPTPRERAPLQSIHAERPFQKVAADITELPITTQGNRYVLVPWITLLVMSTCSQ